jgi:hypothetical protein
MKEITHTILFTVRRTFVIPFYYVYVLKKPLGPRAFKK